MRRPSYDLGATHGSSDRPRRWLLFMTVYCESGLRLPIVTILVILKSKYHEFILRTKSGREPTEPAYAERIRSAPDYLLRVRAMTY